MNTQQAKRIPLEDLLARLGCQPVAASSGDIQALSSTENLASTVPILATLDGSSFSQIDRPAEHVGEFILHMDDIQQTPGSIQLECHQQINIALWAEIVAQGRAEECQFGDLPTAAEVRELLDLKVDEWTGGHACSSFGALISNVRLSYTSFPSLVGDGDVAHLL